MLFSVGDAYIQLRQMKPDKGALTEIGVSEYLAGLVENCLLKVTEGCGTNEDRQYKATAGVL